jgi:hypothetical protein
VAKKVRKKHQQLQKADIRRHRWRGKMVWKGEKDDDKKRKLRRWEK